LNKIFSAFTIIILSASFLFAQINSDMSDDEISTVIETLSFEKINKKQKKNLEEIGAALINEKRFLPAIKIYRILLDLDNSKKQEFLYNVKLGDIEESLDNFQQAISFYETAQLLYPKDIEIKLKIGNVFLKSNLFGLAQDRFQAALSINKNSDYAKKGLGDSYFKQGMYLEALKYYKTISAKTFDEQTFINMIICFKEMNMLSQALNLANQWKEFDMPETHFIIATVYYNLRDYERAKKEFLTSIQEDKNYYPSYMYLAAIALSQNELKLALQYLDNAQELDNNLLSIDFIRAQVYYKQKNYAHAKKFAQNAAKKTENKYNFIFQQAKNLISTIDNTQKSKH
jgi:tetratricopeptide (TPR) repeat protein